MANAAQERRLRNIKVLSEGFHGRIDIMSAAEVDAAVAKIRELADLGRTDRWKHAVDRWAGLIEETPENRRWALIQGSIWAANNA